MTEDYARRTTPAPDEQTRSDWRRILGADLYSLTDKIDRRDSDESATVTHWTASWLAGDLSELTARLSDNTRKAYRIDIGRYFRWCSERHINPSRARRFDFTRYALWLDGTAPDGSTPGPSPARYSRRTRVRYLSAVGSWYAYGREHRFLDHDPTTDVPRNVRREPRSPVLTAADQQALYTAALEFSPDRVRCLTMAAVIALGLDHGWTPAQMIGARVEGLLIDETTHRPAATVTIRGKTRTDVLTDRCAQLLTDLMKARGTTETGPLFTFQPDRPMSTKHLGRILDRIAARAGTSIRVTPHALTRSPPATAEEPCRT